MNYQVGLNNLFEILMGIMPPKNDNKGSIMYNPKFLLINLEKVEGSFKKVPELSIPVYLMDVKHIIAMTGKYIPVYNQNKRLIYSYEEFLEYSKRVSGFLTIPTGAYVFSDKLDFPGIEKYLDLYDQNETRNSKDNQIVSNAVKGVLDNANSNLFSLFKSKRLVDYKLVNTGSTSRNTNLPGPGSDYDYVLKFSYKDEKEKEKKISYMIKMFIEKFHLNRNQVIVMPFRLRMFGVVIPNYPEPIDIDISFVGANQEYFSTDESAKERLTVMRMQDEISYRKVIANIQFAKEFLKKANAYKAYRSDPKQGGLSGIGVENWIMLNGGSFIDAAESFVSAAFTPKGELRPFIDFEKEYSVMDCGKGHVEVARGNFPFRNFVICHMRGNGYEKMAYALRRELESIRNGNRAR